jgi:hypothetical protein
MNPARPSRVQRLMRTRFLVIAAAVAAGIAVASGARADDNFDVSVASGQVTLVAKGDFHINQDYPWKLVVGDVKLDKAKFSLSEKTASVTGAPKGAGTLKGAVCSKDQCMRIEKQITIQ